MGCRRLSALLFEGRFYHTVDGGSTWTLEKLNGMLMIGIDCFDANNCLPQALVWTAKALWQLH